MKKLSATVCAFALVTASVAHAGALNFEGEVEDEVLVADEAVMGGSNAAWIVPLIAIAVIGLAVASGGDDGDDEEDTCDRGANINTAIAAPSPCSK